MTLLSEGELLVVTPGLVSIVVDAGRRVTQAEGFCQSGPMDETAFMWSNWLVGNITHQHAIEIMGRAVFKTQHDMQLAVTGCCPIIAVNGRETGAWQTLGIRAGDSIEINAGAAGKRAYCSIAGRCNIEPVHGSICCVSRERLGGLNSDGQPLKAGDKIVFSGLTHSALRAVPDNYRPHYTLDKPIDVILGYQHSRFSEVAKRMFFHSAFTVTTKISRMGYRLSGPAIDCSDPTLYSEGINVGAIQIPADGQPIIMMRDRQTLGGYPKLGCVAMYDIDRLAHVCPGDTIHFAPIDMNNARSKQLLIWQKRAQILGDNE